MAGDHRKEEDVDAVIGLPPLLSEALEYVVAAFSDACVG